MDIEKRKKSIGRRLSFFSLLIILSFYYCANVNLKLTPKLVVEVLNEPTNG